MQPAWLPQFRFSSRDMRSNSPRKWLATGYKLETRYNWLTGTIYWRLWLPERYLPLQVKQGGRRRLL